MLLEAGPCSEGKLCRPTPALFEFFIRSLELSLPAFYPHSAPPRTSLFFFPHMLTILQPRHSIPLVLSLGPEQRRAERGLKIDACGVSAWLPKANCARATVPQSLPPPSNGPSFLFGIHPCMPSEAEIVLPLCECVACPSFRQLVIESKPY